MDNPVVGVLVVSLLLILGALYVGFAAFVVYFICKLFWKLFGKE